MLLRSLCCGHDRVYIWCAGSMTEPVHDLTLLLNRWKSGDKAAESALIETLYPLLKRSARSALGKCAPGKLSLSATELVHETYLRLIQMARSCWDFAWRAVVLAL